MPQGFMLEPYRWRKRLVLLFAPSAENDTYRAQTEGLETARADLKDHATSSFSTCSATAQAVQARKV